MRAQHPTGVDAGTRTQRLGQFITCLGLVAGVLSLVQTSATSATPRT